MGFVPRHVQMLISYVKLIHYPHIFVIPSPETLTPYHYVEFSLRPENISGKYLDPNNIYNFITDTVTWLGVLKKCGYVRVGFMHSGDYITRLC